MARHLTFRSFLRATAVALLGLVPGCVLLVDSADESLGGRCHFQGEGTLCGQCLAQSCQLQVDACCGEGAACAGEIDACASGNCAAVATGAQAWKSCAMSNCSAACSLAPAQDAGSDTGDAGDAATDVVGDSPVESSVPTTTSCQVAGNQCLCKLDAPPNGVACDATTVINGRCCADLTWPSSGSCKCETLFCEINSFGCECGLIQSGPMFSCAPNTSQPNCCAPHDTGTCLCNKKICESWFGAPVTECTATTTPCPSGKKSVTSCAF